jgi:hypothetical protein
MRIDLVIRRCKGWGVRLEEGVERSCALLRQSVDVLGEKALLVEGPEGGMLESWVGREVLRGILPCRLHRSANTP